MHNSFPNKCVTVHYEAKTLKNAHCLDTLSLASQPGTTENPAVSVISAEEKVKVGQPVEDQLIILKINFSSLYLDRVNRKRSKSPCHIVYNADIKFESLQIFIIGKLRDRSMSGDG